MIATAVLLCFVAMACGFAFGSWWADRHPEEDEQ